MYPRVNEYDFQECMNTCRNLRGKDCVLDEFYCSGGFGWFLIHCTIIGMICCISVHRKDIERFVANLFKKEPIETLKASDKYLRTVRNYSDAKHLLKETRWTDLINSRFILERLHRNLCTTDFSRLMTFICKKETFYLASLQEMSISGKFIYESFDEFVKTRFKMILQSHNYGNIQKFVMTVPNISMNDNQIFIQLCQKSEYFDIAQRISTRDDFNWSINTLKITKQLIKHDRIDRNGAYYNFNILVGRMNDDEKLKCLLVAIKHNRQFANKLFHFAQLNPLACFKVAFDAKNVEIMKEIIDKKMIVADVLDEFTKTLLKRKPTKINNEMLHVLIDEHTKKEIVDSLQQYIVKSTCRAADPIVQKTNAIANIIAKNESHECKIKLHDEQ